MSPPDQASPKHDDFLAFANLADLEAWYRKRGFTGSDEALLHQAQLDWHQAALDQARTISEKPESLEPIVCHKDGVTYHIFGTIHGLIGGDNKEYKDFVENTLRDQDWCLFENGLNLYYPAQTNETIPDFTVLGWAGELALGLRLISLLPNLVLDLFVELFKLRRSSGELLDFDVRYHAVHPETRRGLEPDTLPSRLQIEVEMARWDRGGFWSKLKDPFAIVPRSMFMAGFAEGCAQRTGRTTIPLVVGDLHATEIQRFFEQQTQHPIYEAGRRFANRPQLHRLLAWITTKTRYLFLAALPSVLVIITTLVLITEAFLALKKHGQ